MCQHFLEGSINIDQLSIVGVLLTCLLYDLLEKHLVASYPECWLQQLILSVFIELRSIGSANFSYCLLTDHKMLHVVLGSSCVEDVVCVNLEIWDDLQEDIAIALLMGVIIELFLEQSEDVLMESPNFDN